jgi:ABC-type hemin transport system substrate-binding protein
MFVLPRVRHLLTALVLTLLGVFAFACDREVPKADNRILPSSVTPRIVSLSPAASVILKDLSYESLVVGRHAYELTLPQSLPVCGDQSGIAYETLLSVKPTHVIMEWGSREVPAKFTEMAVANGWFVLNITTLSLQDIAHATRQIDMLMGGLHAGKAAQLATELESMQVVRENPRAEQFGTVLLLASRSPMAALGPGSCHHQILLGLGFLPAIKQGPPYQEITQEDLIAMQPGAIVLIEPATGEVDPGDIPTAVHKVWIDSLTHLKLPATLQGRVSVIRDPLGQVPGTSLIALRDRLRAVLDGLFF